MIEIQWNRSRLCLTLRGHARAAPYGQDLVCAGVSALTRTLAQQISQWESAGTAAGNIFLQPGFAQLQAVPAEENKAAVAAVFDAVALGLSMLAQDFPQCIRMEKMKEDG